jgi:hypothetical protein
MLPDTQKGNFPMAETQFQVADPTAKDSFAAGQPDKFIGTVVSCLAYPYVGQESTDNKHYGFVGWRIIPDEDTGFDEFTQSYFGFYLNRGFPSKDGRTPAGATAEDFIALGAGKSPGLDRSCLDANRHVIPDHENVGPYLIHPIGSKGPFILKGQVDQLYEAVRECDDKGQLKPNGRLDYVVGARFRFDLLKDESPKAKKRDDGSDQMILKPTQLVSLPSETGIGKSAAKSLAGKSSAKAGASTSTASSNGGGDLDAQISAEILTFLGEVGGSANTATLMAKVSSRLAKKGLNKGEVMAWIGERNPKNDSLAVNLIGIDGAEFDPDTDTLTLEE